MNNKNCFNLLILNFKMKQNQFFQNWQKTKPHIEFIEVKLLQNVFYKIFTIALQWTTVLEFINDFITGKNQWKKHQNIQLTDWNYLKFKLLACTSCFWKNDQLPNTPLKFFPLELFFWVTFLTKTAIVTQSPSISPFTIVDSILDILTIFLPSTRWFRIGREIFGSLENNF